MKTIRALAALSLVAAALSAAQPARAQEGVAVVVNGLPITTFDIPQRQRLLQIIHNRAHSRQEALNDLIEDRIKFSEARRNRVEASEQEVQQAYVQVATRAGIDPRGFDEVLRRQGIEPRVYRGKLRADISWSKIVGARFGRTIFITDTQLADAIARRNQGNNRNQEYQFRSVVLLVPANAPAAQVARRMQEAQALRTRFTDCTTGPELVRQIADSAVREPTRRASTDLSPQFRAILDQTQIGRLTNPSRSPQGIEMVAMCGRSEIAAGDRAQRNQVEQEMQTAEMQRISRDYLARLRRTAVIENRIPIR